MLVATLPAGAARAESGDVWRCMDSAGRAQYTNVKSDTEGKQCTQVTKEISVVQTPPAPKPAAAARFPNVDPKTQRARDDSRRKILEDELAGELNALEKAKSALSEQQSVREGGERNYQKVLDRLQPFQDAVSTHEKNVDALQKELADLK